MEVIEKYAKAVTALLIFVFAAIALFWGGDIFGFHINADFESKVLTLIPLAGAAIAVLLTKNATPDAVDKAVWQFGLGVIGVIQFFHEIPAGTVVKISAAVYALIVAGYSVWRVPNSGVQELKTTSALPLNR